jgi:hypothetical protein
MVFPQGIQQKEAVHVKELFCVTNSGSWHGLRIQYKRRNYSVNKGAILQPLYVLFSSSFYVVMLALKV